MYSFQAKAIRDKFIYFKETDEYKNRTINYIENMDENDINELCNSYGQLKILNLHPKIADDYYFGSYNFLDDGDDKFQRFLMSYIIE